MSRPGVGDGAGEAAGRDGSRAAEDERHMRRALREAAAAAARAEVPVGAVLVLPRPDADPLLVTDHNRTRELSDPTAHAEVLVIREAAARRGDWRLTGGTLYVTLEPCAMCAGAAVLARLERIVFGATDPKAGMCGSLENLPGGPRLNHRAEVTPGVLAAESARLLREFFAARRETTSGGDERAG